MTRRTLTVGDSQSAEYTLGLCACSSAVADWVLMRKLLKVLIVGSGENIIEDRTVFVPATCSFFMVSLMLSRKISLLMQDFAQFLLQIPLF